MGLFDFFKKKNNQDNDTTTQTTEKIKTSAGEITIKMGVQTQTDADVIPAEKRIKSAFPSRNNGLYPHEVLVLDYADSFYTKGNSYQRFWWYRYGVKNVDSVLQSLQKKGLITIAPLTSTLEKRTVADIKAVLDDRGISSKGKKAILIQRLMDEVPADELDKAFPERFYTRTEKGDKELKAEEYVSYIHRHSIEDLDIWSLNQLVYGAPSHLPYRDVIWGYLNKKSMEYFSANDFGLYRNCRFCMATFLSEEGKIKGELEMLAEVVFFDLTGAGNNYNPEYLYIIASHFFPYEHSLAKTAPGIIKRIFDCQEKLELSDKALKESLAKGMKKLSAPIQLFSVDECVDIIFYEHTGDTESLDKLYKVAEKRFHKNHPNLKKNPFH